VHPGAGVQSGTLANAIAHHFELEQSADGGQQSEARIGIVHRLDKDTSGLIVVAKTDEMHEALSEQFRERTVYKSYVALVHGSPDTNTGKIEAPIGRNKHNRLRMKVATHGRSALSLWKVRKRYDKFTLLDVEIKTGRTHQIRVHMGYINHPVVGDEIYNEGRDNTVADTDVRNAIRSLGRFFLHAERLSFTHPKTSERLEFKQELPEELTAFLGKL
jgi:23S rRNA pseudouridine1911/1915/1917 synthase